MEKYKYNRWQLVSLVIMRILIGWHFLHEGMVKLLDVNWTSASYLKDTKWLFSGMFTSMAENPGLLKMVDFLNIWGLIIIGFCLITGLLSRYAIIFGIVLLSLYFLCSIPIPGYEYVSPAEGNYLIVNKNLIELSALVVLLVFPSSKEIGLDRFLIRKKMK